MRNVAHTTTPRSYKRRPATPRHPHHVLDGDEGVVDGDDLDAVLLDGGTEHEATDAAESVDSNSGLGHGGRRLQYVVLVHAMEKGREIAKSVARPDEMEMGKQEEL